MMEIFAFDFMRKAFLAGVLLAVIVPCIGVIIVFKRLSMIGDALAHTALAGVAAGLLMGFNPVAGAVAASIAASLGIEAARRKMPGYAELSVAIMMSAGIGLAGVLSGFPGSAGAFGGFLFGSIVSISDLEIWMVTAISLTVAAVFALMYKELFLTAFDERGARLAGVKVTAVNTVFIVLTAITVSIASRTIGALVVSSLMVLPVACSMRLARSYFQTVVFSIMFGLLFTVTGLTLSFYLGLRPGATIVLIGCGVLVLLLIVRRAGHGRA